MNPTQPQLDPQVLAMTKAIRTVESNNNFGAKGASGEYGGYQFTPETWAGASKKFLGESTDLMSATPEQQNQVAYKQVEEWKNAGYNVGQVASMWNAGKGKPNAYVEGNAGTNDKGVAYDTAAYAQKVANAYQQIKSQMTPPMGASGIPGIPTAEAATGQSQPQSGTSGPSVSGFIGNVASSAGNVLSGLGQAALHPIKTAQSVLGTVAGGVEKALGGNNEDTQMFDNAVGYFKNRYGGDSLSQIASNIGNTAYKDPVGMALDVSTLLDGVGAAVSGAAKVSKIAELSKAAELIKSASSAVNPIATGAKIAGKAANTGLDVAKFGVSKIIGFSRADDVTSLINNYDKLGPEQRAAMSRESLASEFGDAGDQIEQNMKDGGKAKGGVIAANAGKTITAPENWLADVLENGTTAPLEDGSKAIPFKLKLVPEYPPEEPGVIQMEAPKPIGYKVVSDTTSKVYDSKDIAAVQKFVDKWAPKLSDGMSAEEFSNMRQALGDMSKFGRELGKNLGAEKVGMALRADANRTMRPQITGLAESDASNAPRIQEWNRYKKEFLTKSPTGTGYDFKPGAPNKLFNALGKGKGDLARFIEKVSPGMTKRIELLKTAESIESSLNLKVGTYGKDFLAIGSLLHGNIPGVIASIISHPSIAVPLLRGLGWTKAQIAPIVQFLRVYANSNTLRYPTEAGMISNSTQQGPQASPSPNKNQALPLKPQ